uniref:Sodium-and chloride-dependent GABA transporter 1 n=1 Tax=Macrostomum lignano TaxID=282301 RepID=A0A1I8IDP4_9PLAT
MLVIGGIPLFYMELALASTAKKMQTAHLAFVNSAHRAGIGLCVVMIAFFTDFFYNVIIAWSLYFLFASFAVNLPWTSCNNTWNMPTCYDEHLSDKVAVVTANLTTAIQTAVDANSTGTNLSCTRVLLPTSPNYEAEKMSTFKPWLFEASVGGHGPPGPGLTTRESICQVHHVLGNHPDGGYGIGNLGTVQWKLAMCLALVYIICYFSLWKGISMSGKVFFSLAPSGFGVLLAFAPPTTNSTTTCTNPGLVFTVYPEALATLPGSTFWSLCFFLMLMTLGLDSSFGGSEAIITGVSDEFTIIRRNRELFVLGLFVFYYSVGLAEVTQGGIYILNMLERFSVQYSILIAVLFETMCVSWIYGVDRFRENIREMTGILPGIYWKLCWKFLAPIFIMFNIAFGLYQHEPLSMGSYKYPLWANVVGWMLAASSVMWIPIVAIVQIIKTPGTLRERIAFLLTPQLSSVQQGNGAAERPKVAATEEEVAEILQELDIKALKEDAV